MKKYTFYTNKKIVGLFLISQIISIILTSNLALFSKYTSVSVIYSIIVGLIYISIFLHQTAVILSTDNNCLQKGFIFKKNIYWNSITRLRAKEQYLTIFEGTKTCIINLNILKVTPEKYKSFFNDIKENISDDVEIDSRSSELLSGAKITTSIDYPIFKLGGWLMYIYVMICLSLVSNVLMIPGCLFGLFNGVNDMVYAIRFFASIITIIMTVVTLIPFSRRKHSAIKLIKIYYLVTVFTTIIMKLANHIEKNNDITHIVLSLLGSLIYTVLMALMITEYLNTSVRVKNTLVANPTKGIGRTFAKVVDNSKKRVTILFFGKVDSSKAPNWYNQIKEELSKDEIIINKIMASPDKLVEKYSKYYKTETHENIYLENISSGNGKVEFRELGFCSTYGGKDNTSAYCYGDMSWGKHIYKEGMSLSFSYSVAQKVAIERYIDIYKKYIDWNWIYMYEIDYNDQVKVKKLKGHMVEHSSSKNVLNEWKRSK